MRKLKLTIILPIIQVLVASTLLLLADRNPTPSPNFPVAWLLCRSLNAPVMLLMILFGGNWNFVPQIPFVGRAFFLITVGLLWYFVGRALHRGGAQPAKEPRVVAVLVVQSLLMVTGVLLLTIGWRELSDKIFPSVGSFIMFLRVAGYTSPLFGYIGTLFTLTWSVSLIFLSGRTIVRTIRRGLARSG